MVKDEKAIRERLKRYDEERKKVNAPRSWESGYLLGIVDTLKWVLNNDHTAGDA